MTEKKCRVNETAREIFEASKSSLKLQKILQRQSCVCTCATWRVCERLRSVWECGVYVAVIQGLNPD